VHTTKIYEGVEVWLRLLLITALDGSEWPGSRSGHFTTEERAADTHCTGDWLHPRAGPELWRRKNLKISCVYQKSVSDISVIQLVALFIYRQLHPGSTPRKYVS
jgi:hypothetical protein